MAVSEQLLTTTVTIANGASLSGAADLDQYTLAAVVLPGTWTAAALTFQVTYDGTNYFDLSDKDGEVSISSTVAVASKAIALEPYKFLRVAGVKVRSGTSGTPVNQGGARILTLVYSPL